jgi:hypothetical protein
MDNLIKLPVPRRGWWEPQRALTASLNFKGCTRLIMHELIARTDCDGFVVAEANDVAGVVLVAGGTVKSAKKRLIEDGVLRRTEVSTRYVWDAERLGVLAAQVVGRGSQKRLSDDNLCSQVPDFLAEVALDIQALAEAYVAVHYDDKRWRMVGTPPWPKLGAKNIDAAKSKIRDYFARVMPAVGVSRSELALYTNLRFHRSTRKALEECGFLFSFLPFELSDLEKSVKNAILEDRRKLVPEQAKPAAAEPAGVPPPADFMRAAGLR